MTAYSRVALQQASATIKFPQEAVSCAFAETFSLFVESLNVGLGASEENDFDKGVPRRILVLTTSQGVPCEGSFFCRCMPEADNWTKCPRGQYNRPLADPAASHQLGRTK